MMEMEALDSFDGVKFPMIGFGEARTVLGREEC